MTTEMCMFLQAVCSMRLSDSVSFEGTFENDEKKHGVFKWRNGDVYEGDFKYAAELALT